MDSPNYGSRSSSSTQNYTKTHDMLRWKSGKRVDPRLLILLELFEEIYTERHEFFKKIFHGKHEEVFKKIGDALEKKKTMKKARCMSRSLSMRAIQQRGVDEESDEMRLERFKVKTPNVIVAGPTGEEAQPQTTQGSSKD